MGGGGFKGGGFYFTAIFDGCFQPNSLKTFLETQIGKELRAKNKMTAPKVCKKILR